jgi:hypothetical protein
LLDKIGTRRETAQKLAKGYEEQLEAAKTEHARLEGAKGVLRTNAQECVSAVRSYWKKDWDEEKITKEAADTAFKVIEQISGALRSLAQKCEVDQLVKQGLVEGLEKSIKSCEKLFEEEGTKAKNFLDAVEKGDIEIDKETGEPVHTKPAERGEDGRPPLHVVGVRPEPGIAARRKAEEKAAAETEAKNDESKPDSKGKKPKGKKRLTGADQKGT